MAMTQYIRLVGVMLICAMSPGQSTSAQLPQNDHLPRMPHSNVLGLAPLGLYMTTPGETVLLEPGLNQASFSQGGMVYPSITRDGDTIAYSRSSPSQHSSHAISTYTVSTNKHKDIEEGTFSGSVAISPDGLKLAYGGMWGAEHANRPAQVTIVDLKTGIRLPGPDVPNNDWPIKLSWSPDAKWLAYSFDGEIYIWDPVNGVSRHLATGAAPTWSPSGEWVAYLQFPWGVYTAKVPQQMGPNCHLIRPDGSDGHVLTKSYSKHGVHILRAPPVWSPDSNTILLSEVADLEKGTSNVNAINVQTGLVRRMFKNTGIVYGWAAVAQP